MKTIRNNKTNFISQFFLLIAALILMILTNHLNAQSKENASGSSNKLPTQSTRGFDQSLEGTVYKDKNAKKWTVGVLAGSSFFFGDADLIQPGWAIGPYLKYSISHTFGLRAEYNLAQLKGKRDFQSPTLYKDNFSFVSKLSDWNLQMHFTLGNISYLRPVRKTQLYLFAGLGQVNFNSKAQFIDQRIYLGDYYLSNYFGSGTTNPNYGKKVEERYQSRNAIVPVGLGLKHILNDHIDIGLEYRQTFVRNDDIDVYNTQIWQNRRWDSYSFLRVSLGYKFGSKKMEHNDWINPIETLYDKIARLDSMSECLGKDGDNDHVPDCYDQEPNTPDSCMVYGNGMSVDSDRDGLPDCQDSDPFSEKGALVDSTGRAIDSDGDGVPDFRDREPFSSSPGALVDANGIEINSSSFRGKQILPDLEVELNKNISSGTKSMVLMASDKLKYNPEKKLYITAPGGKSSKYNAEESTRFINKLIDELVEKYGISRDRVIVDYNGKGNKTNYIKWFIE